MKSNVRVSEGVQDAGRVANRTARSAASSRWMIILARLGYAAKGVVYLMYIPHGHISSCPAVISQGLLLTYIRISPSHTTTSVA
jgi:hypothetical protein